jgi:PAS domain S-box-containing protein
LILKEQEEITPHSYDNDFENIVDLSPIPLLIHYMGVVRYVNSDCLRLFGFNHPSQLFGKNLLEFTHPDDVQEVKAAIQTGIKNKVRNQLLISRMINIHGEIIKVETKSSSIQFRGEDCRLVVAYNYDLAAKMQSELNNKNLILDKIAMMIPDSLIVVDNITREVLFENKPLVETLGYTEADFGGQDQFRFIVKIIHPDDIDKLVLARKFLYEPANAGKYISTEYRIKNKAGQWRWILSRSTLFKKAEEEGHQLNFGIAQDITWQKEAEEELRKNKLLVDKITKTVPNHISVYSINNFERVYNNFFFGELLGYTPDDSPQSIFDFFAPDHQEHALSQWSKLPFLADGEIFTSLDKYLTKDGKIKYILSNITPFLRDENGQIEQVLTTSMDVTEFKETEFKLQLSEQTQKAILSSLPDMVFQVEKSGKILSYYANENYKEPLDSLHLTERFVTDLLPGEDADNVMRLLEQVIDNNRIHSYEYIHYESGTKMNYEFRISRRSENSVIVIARDITPLANARQQLDQKITELSIKNAELEKYITSNTELEKFAYIASHDLREPVRSIVGFTQLLQKRNEQSLDAESKEFLSNIIESAQRMNSLIHGLLDYSRVSTAGKRFQFTDLNDTLQKMKADINTAIEESGAEILIDKLPTVFCDDLQIRQLFQNLISNAIKFRSKDASSRCSY